MIVLANSRKLGGRCVAGISTSSGEWIRPVSDLAHGELDTYRCRVDGRQAALLDVVRFDYTERCDDPVQPENVLVADTDWDLVDVIDPSGAYPRLRDHLSPGPVLLGNRGKAVKGSVAEAGLDASLALIEPTAPVELVLQPPGETGGKLKPSAAFELDGKEYELRLTDYVVAPRVQRAGVGRHAPEDLGLPVGDRTLLTVSLAEAHNQWHTKLAAAMLFLP